MRRPVIAVTSSHNKENKICMSPAYFRAIYKSGGAACFLPSFDFSGMGELSRSCEDPRYEADSVCKGSAVGIGDIISLRREFLSDRTIEEIRSYAGSFDGFLFAGGVDVHPFFYGDEIRSERIELDIYRDIFEMELLSAVIKTGKPILGICRGIQLINVALGGTLYQHIDGHMQTEPKDARPFHVSASESSPLEKITGKRDIYVNSFHHQAVNALAPSLECCAVSDDGIIEGAALCGYGFFLAVQWHPELFFESDPSASAIFRSFILAAEGSRRHE